MEPGHTYCQAAVVVDQYGRKRVYPNLLVEYDPEEGIANPVEAQEIYPQGVESDGWTY